MSGPPCPFPRTQTCPAVAGVLGVALFTSIVRARYCHFVTLGVTGALDYFILFMVAAVVRAVRLRGRSFLRCEGGGGGVGGGDISEVGMDCVGSGGAVCICNCVYGHAGEVGCLEEETGTNKKVDREGKELMEVRSWWMN